MIPICPTPFAKSLWSNEQFDNDEKKLDEDHSDGHHNDDDDDGSESCH